jgi:hypothetical protein
VIKICSKLPYCARKVDPCIDSQVYLINRNAGKGFKTVSSCCGHGKYKPTIVCLRTDGKLIEWFSSKFVGEYNFRKKKQYNRIYKKDPEGFYFVPNVSVLKNG